ncbi:MAG: TrmH family RNA methyltransferase [Acidimicrobiales bacterium]
MAFAHRRVQRLRRLSGRASARSEEACFVAEGAKVIGEALRAGAPIDSVYFDASSAGPEELALLSGCEAAGCQTFELAPGVLARFASTVTPQPVVALVGKVDVSLPTLLAKRPALVVVCAEVRDPGNAGTVMRSAAAAGAEGVVFCSESVDPFNPKTVRASAGALFQIAVVAGGEPGWVLHELAEGGLTRWGAVARGGEDYTDVDLGPPFALVVGNEAHGLPDGLEAGLDGLVSIPMPGGAESLNVGTATAVILFEAARQRRHVAAQGAGR